ncbi:MAG: oxygenase MpaB family protein [Acidimicrobiales bacterium]
MTGTGASVVRLVTQEPAVALLAGRALVLQLAHPAVAQGVHDHSDFRQHPFRRLQGTLASMYTVAWGSAEQAAAVGRRVRRAHQAVTGPSYRATSPENLLWVHATLVDSSLLAYTMFVGTLDGEQQEAFYQEMKEVAAVFGLHPHLQPPTLLDFRAYFDETVQALQVTDTARDLIRYVLRPGFGLAVQVALAPALGLERLITVGTTPAPIRDRAGLDWDLRRQVLFEGCRLGLRAWMRAQPRAVRTAPVRVGGQLVLRSHGAEGVPNR